MLCLKSPARADADEDIVAANDNAAIESGPTPADLGLAGEIDEAALAEIDKEFQLLDLLGDLTEDYCSADLEVAIQVPEILDKIPVGEELDNKLSTLAELVEHRDAAWSEWRSTAAQLVAPTVLTRELNIMSRMELPEKLHAHVKKQRQKLGAAATTTAPAKIVAF